MHSDERDNAEKSILAAIRDSFEVSPAAKAAPLGNGHINQTVLVTDGDRHLVAQRINTTVFRQPEDLVHKARAIESHLARKGGPLRVVRHMPGRDGRYLFGPNRDVRVLEYIPDSRSIEVLENSAQGELAAASFARFARLLSDFDASQLRIVIPDFHSPVLRWRQFRAALEADAAGRAQSCLPETAFAGDGGRLTSRWQELMDRLPVRVAHNDCKINNMLVDRHSGEALAIIDLDTCMPGTLLTDFGDLVRTCCSPEPEDSTRLDRVRARPEIYQALVRGYESGWAGELTDEERSTLFEGGLMMSFVLGLRFLTDYLAGDTYFSVAHPAHNLERARNQFRLFESLSELQNGQ